MTLNKHLQEALVEFEEKFVGEKGGIYMPKQTFNNIKSFLSQKLRDISVKVAEEILPEPKVVGGDYMDNDECERRRGFNSAISQMRENITKLKE